MSADAELLAQVAQALAGGEQTPMERLQVLYYQCFNEGCRRRARIAYKLQNYLNKYSAEGVAPVPASAELLSPVPTDMATSENYRFKSAFKHKKAIVHLPSTRFVTAGTLTDEDVQPLRDAGMGHFIEVIPGREAHAEAALAPKADEQEEGEDEQLPSLNVNKPELQAIYEQELGEKPDEELRVDDLKAAIKQHRNTPA